YLLELADAFVGDVALIRVDAFAQRGVTLASGFQPVVGKFEQVGEGGVSERQGRRVGHGGRHVGHAIVEHAIHEIDGFGVRGGVGGVGNGGGNGGALGGVVVEQGGL